MKSGGRLLKDENVIASELCFSRSFRERLKGVIGLGGLGPGKAVLIEPCNAIHTCFVRFDLDAIFLDKHCRVVKICREIRPGRLMVSGGLRAFSVVEMESGWFDWNLLHEGDVLTVEESEEG